MAAASVSQKFEKLIIGKNNMQGTSSKFTDRLRSLFLTISQGKVHNPYHASPSKPSDTFHGTKNTMTSTEPLPKPVSMPKPGMLI
ncbi:hypothetical protein I4U23_015383 [Adineta vaga]|nr:hypothetical protein I4U23_015383 [Adineta vaga]